MVGNFTVLEHFYCLDTHTFDPCQISLPGRIRTIRRDLRFRTSAVRDATSTSATKQHFRFSSCGCHGAHKISRNLLLFLLEDLVTTTQNKVETEPRQSSTKGSYQKRKQHSCLAPTHTIPAKRNQFLFSLVHLLAFFIFSSPLLRQCPQ